VADAKNANEKNMELVDIPIEVAHEKTHKD
jgi:hypothetical protein